MKDYILVFADVNNWLLYPRSPKGEGGILFYLCPSVQDIFRRIFLSNCWWQKSDIWSQASYRYTILWVVFLDPSDSYFLLTLLIFIHIEHICSFFVAFFSTTIDGRNLIFGDKLHIGTHIVGSVFGPIRFLLPVCQHYWFLYTLNIYAHISSHFSQQLLMAEIWYLVTNFI
jgi:hypothetical protein